MANHSTSALVAFLIAIIIIAIGQIMKNDLAASKAGTLIAGALGSLVFVFLLTALSNFQMSSISEQVKAGLTEVFLCLVVAVIASATIHRVAITVCLLFSAFLLFLLTGISQTRYTTTVVQNVVQQRKKK
ncbi:keratinocyte associated protein 2 [Loa loa]|uniref:Keratinocyte associated protein 2 n=1 Tax=Loa loa TaxID=7209 RepID=A0A1I7VEH5_LOALO|nr:keratinocyte associated protein 2 [Loa loa]EFO26076.1 keratinocyte associated protein 2 [Loa loa]